MAGYGGYYDGYGRGGGGMRGGRGGGMMAGGAAPRSRLADISFNTSSNDPILVRSRVFVGNIDTNAVSREELLELYVQYGEVLGCTMFKGYAFIQFGSELEAQNAVYYTKGMTCHGTPMDVKLSIDGKNKEGGAADQSNGGGGAPSDAPLRKRGAMEAGGGAFGGGFGPGGDAAKASRWSAAAPHAPGAKEYILEGELDDILMCGKCRSVYNEVDKFNAHKAAGCQEKKPAKDPSEPETLKCFMCKDEHKSSWSLLNHLSEKHQLSLCLKE